MLATGGSSSDDDGYYGLVPEDLTSEEGGEDSWWGAAALEASGEAAAGRTATVGAGRPPSASRLPRPDSATARRPGSVGGGATCEAAPGASRAVYGPAGEDAAVRDSLQAETVRESLSLAALALGGPGQASTSWGDGSQPALRASLQAETVRESLSLKQAMAKPPLPPAPSNAREGEAREVGEEGGPAGRHVPESAVDDLLRLPSAPGPAARSPQLALSAEELGFLHEVLDDEGGGGSDEESGGSMAAGMPPVTPYEDPPPGTLGRMLHAEIQSELQPEVDLDFTHLSVCSRSELGSEASAKVHQARDPRALAALRTQTLAVQAKARAAQAGGHRRRALGLAEQALGMLVELEGPEGGGVLEACEALAEEYNAQGLGLLEAADFDAAFELFKKAEMLTAPGSALDIKPEARRRLRAITFNNLGCYYKQRGKLHAALHYLERTLKIEEAAATGAVENPASTHLNIAATLSTLGRHSAAVEYAREAVELLQAELQMDSTADLMAETDAKMEAQPGSAPLAAKLSILAAALYNQAVELEHLGQGAQALLAYTQAAYVARRSAGPQSSMAIMLHKAQAAYRKKTGQMQARRLQSARSSRRSSGSAPSSTGEPSGRHAVPATAGGKPRAARPDSAPTTTPRETPSKAPTRRPSRAESATGSKLPRAGIAAKINSGAQPPNRPLLNKTSSLPTARHREAAAPVSSGGRKATPAPQLTRSTLARVDPAAAAPSEEQTARVLIRLRKVTPKDGIAPLGHGGALYRNGQLVSADGGLQGA